MICEVVSMAPLVWNSSRRGVVGELISDNPEGRKLWKKLHLPPVRNQLLTRLQCPLEAKRYGARFTARFTIAGGCAGNIMQQ